MWVLFLRSTVVQRERLDENSAELRQDRRPEGPLSAEDSYARPRSEVPGLWTARLFPPSWSL